MLHVLLESGPRDSKRGTGWTVASVAMHLTLGAAAVALTAHATAPAAVGPVASETVIFSAPQPAPEPVLEPAIAEAGVLPTVPTIPVPAISIPAPRFDPLSVLPTAPLDPIASGAGEPTGTVTATVPSSSVFSRQFVDKTVAPRADNPTPTYPVSLRAASVEGEVFVAFVVDTLGRVEPSSIQIISETHSLFGLAVRRWLAITRYVPAEIAGQRVRQLVQQQVGFTLRR